MLSDIIIGAIIGSLSTIIGIVFNNFYLLKKEKLAFENNEKMFEKKHDFEIRKTKEHKKEQEIKDIYMLLYWFEKEYSKTSLVNKIDNNQSKEESSKKFKEDVYKLNMLKYYIDFNFPFLYERVEILDGCIDNFWNNQQLILNIEKSGDKSDLIPMMNIITEIDRDIQGQIRMIKMEIREKNKKALNIHSQ